MEKSFPPWQPAWIVGVWMLMRCAVHDSAMSTMMLDDFPLELHETNAVIGLVNHLAV